MANYVIYTYQFAPLSNDGQKLFEDLPSVTERMEMKQVYLQDILANEHFKFKSVREGVFDYQRRYNRDGIIIFKLANNKRLNLEEHFQKKRHDYSPSCFVIIDNRHNIQHIAIEEDTTLKTKFFWNFFEKD